MTSSGRSSATQHLLDGPLKNSAVARLLLGGRQQHQEVEHGLHSHPQPQAQPPPIDLSIKANKSPGTAQVSDKISYYSS